MDEKGYSGNRLVYWILELVSMAGSAISWYFDLKGFFLDVDWRLLAIIFSAIFAVVCIRRIWMLEDDLWQKIPRVTLAHHPYLDGVQMDSEKPFIISPRGDTVNRNISRFLHVAFANIPAHNTENNHAKRLTARLIYKDHNGRLLIPPIYARWSNSVPPKSRDDLKKLIYYELDSGGKPEPIDIAFKIDSEDVCYAYNNESYFASDLKVLGFQISSKVVNVKIELRGERVKKNFSLRFYNDGKDKPLRIDEQTSWIRRIFQAK